MQFALTKNASLEDRGSKAIKKYTHVECGTELKPTAEATWYCPRCLKTGYLVKKKAA